MNLQKLMDEWVEWQRERDDPIEHLAIANHIGLGRSTWWAVRSGSRNVKRLGAAIKKLSILTGFSQVALHAAALKSQREYAAKHGR